jgi:hypothetical protein
VINDSRSLRAAAPRSLSKGQASCPVPAVGKQDSPLQGESVRMRQARQAIEKAFEGVELD